jgi:hypothetical protein
MPWIGLHAVTLLLLSGAEGTREPIGRLDHPPIREASGLVASRRHPGVFWVHNDSGNPPALFAVRRDGSLIREYRVAAPNIDWEAIALDDAGHLFLGDIGNNGGVLPLRAVYRLDEPDPSQPAAGPLPATAAVVYRFPADGRFDAEGMVWDGPNLLVFSKRLDSCAATVHALPLDGSATLLRPALPTQVDILEDFTEPITAADLSADGLLAVASYRVARVYARVGDVGWAPIGAVAYRGGGIEAVAWDGPDLILAGEGRGMYRIPEAAWRGRRSAASEP